jgi:hypothetical protein
MALLSPVPQSAYKMRTPAGKECRFYYADYHRGSQKQECRLIARNPDGGRWHPSKKKKRKLNKKKKNNKKKKKKTEIQKT